jgi:hypothetical protein
VQREAYSAQLGDAMAKRYRTLLINCISGTDRFLGAWRDTQDNQLAYDIHSLSELKRVLSSLLAANTTFDAAVFSTHGNKGVIWFDEDSLAWWDIYQNFFPGNYSSLMPSGNGRILFGGCNVADGDDGWKFLLAAARSFLEFGGEAIGWTSKGFQAPFGLRDGHIIHLWGDSRQVRNMGGGTFRFYENWDLIESGGVPQAPAAVANVFR